MPPQNVVGEAFIRVHADTSAVPGEITKGTEAGVVAGEKAATGASQSLGGLAKAAGGVLVLGAVAKVMGGFVDAASAVNREGRITTQLLKNQGDAATVTKGHIDALTRSISLKTGEDQAQLRATANILLAFKDVQNTGKGMNAVFDRTLKAAGDISTVMGTDTSGAAKILGKALSDPIKGLTLLRRAGVLLPPNLEAQIKAMGDLTVASGKTTDAHGKHAVAAAKHGKVISDTNKLHAAQQILLGAIEGKYKGTAEAAASSGTKLRAQLKDLQITFGQLLLPAIKATNQILSHLLEIFNHLPGPVKTILPALGLLAGAIVGIALVAGPLVTAFGFIAPVIAVIAGLIGTFVSGPLLLIGIAIAALAILVIKNWDTIKRVTLGALNAVKDAVFAAFHFLQDHFKLIVNIILLPIAPLAVLLFTVIHHFDQIKGAIADAFQFIFGVFTNAVGFIRDHIALIGEIILSLVAFPAEMAIQVARHFNSIVDFIGSIPGRIAGLIGSFFSIGRRLIEAIVDGILAAPSAIINAIKSLIPGPLRHLLGGIGGAIGAIGGFLGFQTGGVVPGPLGVPQLIIAHGGERVTPAGRSPQGGGTSIVFGPQSIVVSFSGAVPTEGQAFRTGKAIGDGIATRLTTRRSIATAARVA